MNPKQKEVLNLLGYLPIEERMQLQNNDNWETRNKVTMLENRVKLLNIVVGATYVAVLILTWKVGKR